MGDNYFKKHKLLISFFILAFIAFLVSALYSYRGLYFDVPAQFIISVNSIFNDYNTGYLHLTDQTTRNFSLILYMLPFNLLLFITKDLLGMLNLFTASFYLMPFLCLGLNYLIALRTKRFDIAVLCLVFYAFFIIPNAVWVTREIHLATVLQFALMSYFLTREKLNKMDIIPIFLLLLYLFESFESAALLGIILFIGAANYYQKHPEGNNAGAKLLIGLVGVAVAIYIPLRLLFLSMTVHLNLVDAAPRWWWALSNVFSKPFDDCLPITWLGIALCIIAFFIHREFSKKDYIISVPIFVLFGFLFYQKTHFIPWPSFEIAIYSLTLIVLPIIFIVLMMLETCNIDLEKINKHYYSNLIVIACVIGVLHFAWQINSSVYCRKYVDYLKSYLVNPKTPSTVALTNGPEDKGIFVYEECFGSTHRSLLLSPEYKVKTIIFPDKTFGRYHDFCEDGVEGTYFAEKSNRVFLQGQSLKIKNRFWDLSDIVTEFKKEGRVAPL